MCKSDDPYWLENAWNSEILLRIASATGCERNRKMCVLIMYGDYSIEICSFIISLNGFNQILMKRFYSSSSNKSIHGFDFGTVLFEHSIAIAFKTIPYLFFSFPELVFMA